MRLSVVTTILKPMFSIVLTKAKLATPSLVRTMSSKLHKLDVPSKCFVDGKWVAGDGTFEVKNPSTGKVIGSVPEIDEMGIELAGIAGEVAFPLWTALSAEERATHLKRWFDVLEENKKDLATLITYETGKPLVEAEAEVNYANSIVKWFSEEAKRTNGDVVQSPAEKQLMFIRQPIGIVFLITPYTFPMAMVMRKAAAAMAAGCACIVKPAEDAPLTALALGQTAHLAGMPDGLFNVVTCSRESVAKIGALLCQHENIAGVSFTGSTKVGKVIYHLCAGVKRISMELGGNAPFIVFKTADIDRAVDSTMAAKFRGAGQSCISPNRLFIHEDLFNSFVKKMVGKIKKIKLGDGFDKKVTMGPLINQARVKKVVSIVEDAVSNGAKVECGGKVASEIGENFFQPTLLTNVNTRMRCMKEEIFGPVIPCMSFSSDQDVVDLVNDTDGGLPAYFFTNDVSQAKEVAKDLNVGTVWINESMISAEIVFGGVGQPGLGKEGSKYGTDEYTYIRAFCFGTI